MIEPSGLSTFHISGSGLTADQLWMDVIAENLANANSTNGPGGKPYSAQEVVLTPGSGGTVTTGAPLSGTPSGSSFGSNLTAAMGVHVSQVVSSTAPFPLQYDPGAPGANAQGYVAMPNVNPVVEMSNLVVAS